MIIIHIVMVSFLMQKASVSDNDHTGMMCVKMASGKVT